ncbi:hypothetical protein ACFUN7_22570 [Streptomyces sp. NPDC057236]|uniref:hypothetical protein n=1 Tax=Streptomyces sp. NPDC057236 TaxID=3346059 RepID=UPI003626BA9E
MSSIRDPAAWDPLLRVVQASNAERLPDAVGATGAEIAVRGLVGSPGWIASGDNGGGDRLALDLTPGPAGHTERVVVIGHEWSVGAGLRAGSLTDMVVNRRKGRRSDEDRNRPPVVVRVNVQALENAAAVARPEPEALRVGGRPDDRGHPVSGPRVQAVQSREHRTRR